MNIVTIKQYLNNREIDYSCITNNDIHVSIRKEFCYCIHLK